MLFPPISGLRALLLQCALWCTLLAVCPAWSAAVTVPDTSGSSGFGSSTGWRLPYMSAADQDHTLSEIEATGVTWVRFDISWSTVQSAGRDSWNWAPYDALISRVHAHNLRVLATLTYSPAWANGGHSYANGGDDHWGPVNPADYARFAGAAAQRYGSRGVHVYEIWNEPNHGPFWHAPNVATYTSMLKQSYTAIHQADPDAFVITGGTSPAPDGVQEIAPVTFLKGIYANGGKGSFDAVGHHPYSYPYGISTAAVWNAWQQMAWSDFPSAMRPAQSSLREVMVANGDDGKRIWATEWGFPTATHPGKDVTEAAQGDLLAQGMRAWQRYPWAGALIVYSIQDNGGSDDGFGLLRADWSRRPAFAAVKSVATNGTVYATSRPSYTGWAKVDGAAQVTAWSWSAGEWNSSSLTNGEWVYVWPYGGEWRWGWTQRTGWVAVRAVSVRIAPW